jgi:2-desacetyl-2-hydroxyethyl bacteriochlorophyllide A dehydrogenase
MKSRILYFRAPRRIEIRAEDVSEPAEGEVRIEAEVSSISAGTELLLYRGRIPRGTVLDESLKSLSGTVSYPLAYGYSNVGRVVAQGATDPTVDLMGRRVFAFETHRSSFLARPEELHLVPEDVSPESATLLPTVETAFGLVHDARPLMGERVLVIGQGVVGLVTTALLSRFPLARLVTVDRWERRRRLSVELGAARSLSPEELDEGDFDLTLEVSGSPEALDVALGATGFEGRVIVGSWYGDKRADVDLGTHFHRGRLNIQSSQVSRLPSHLLSRWTKERRLNAALGAISRLPLRDLVSHRFPIERAEEAYRLLDERPQDCLQVLLTYD